MDGQRTDRAIIKKRFFQNGRILNNIIFYKILYLEILLKVLLFIQIK